MLRIYKVQNGKIKHTYTVYNIIRLCKKTKTNIMYTYHTDVEEMLIHFHHRS